MDVHEQQRALGRLTRDVVWGEGDLQRVLERITETAAKILAVARASIWLYEDDKHDSIRCVDMWRGLTQDHVRGDVILRAQVPRYFAALERERIIPASDAREDPSTVELRTPYLEEHDIGALLDAPIVIDGRSVGVICHEHVGASRGWFPEETLLVASLGDIVAIALESARTREVTQQLSARQEELHLALQAASMGAWSWDEETDTVRWGDALGPLLGFCAGFDPGTLQKHLEHVHAQDRDHVERQFAAMRTCAATRASFSLEYRAASCGSTEAPRWLRMTGRKVGEGTGADSPWRGVIFDISDEKDVRDQLASAQRLDELGRLAGGVAHDFNNLLTVIRSSAAVLNRCGDPSAGSVVPVEVAIIEDAARRGAALTGQLLSFARRQRVDPQEVDICELVTDASSLLRRLLSSQVRLEVQVADEQLVARIDPMQFEQVLVNVVVNAKDAMPLGGVIRVDCGLEEVAEGQLHPAPARICVRVVDEGSGMSPAVRARAMEPFFTTKESGRGTGLGLSTSYGILQQAGGELVLRSEEGRGTTVAIYLPRVAISRPLPRRKGAPHSSLVDLSESPRAGSASRQQEDSVGLRLMLVDDQEMVRRSVGQMLRHAGHAVHEFGSGAAALRAFENLEPQVVITDVVMPEMSGRQFADALTEAHSQRIGQRSGQRIGQRSGQRSGQRAALPDPATLPSGYERVLPIILMSGFSSEPVATKPWERWISKPFEPDDLQELIVELAVLYGEGE